MGKATDDLRNEHSSISHALNIYDDIASSGPKEESVLLKYYTELVYFLKIFADKCHHGKEEDYLFKDLGGKGVLEDPDLINHLLREHKLARDYIVMMDEALGDNHIEKFNDAFVKYQELLRRHMRKEETGIFLIADELLKEAVQDILFEEFEAHEEKVVGHGVHEELHAMIHRWEEL